MYPIREDKFQRRARTFWFLFFLLAFMHIALANLTSHVESTIDALLLAFDPDANGVPNFSEANIESWLGAPIATETEAKSYVTGQQIGAFNLSDDTCSFAKIWPMVAGGTFAQWAPVYMKTDGANGGRIYGYDANEADANTYLKIGRAMTAGSSGTTVNVIIDGDYVCRNDSYNFTYNSDEGRPLWCGTGGAGYESLTKPTTSGDHQIISSFIIQVDNAGTGDYFMGVTQADVSQP